VGLTKLIRIDVDRFQEPEVGLAGWDHLVRQQRRRVACPPVDRGPTESHHIDRSVPLDRSGRRRGSAIVVHVEDVMITQLAMLTVAVVGSQAIP